MFNLIKYFWAIIFLFPAWVHAQHERGKSPFYIINQTGADIFIARPDIFLNDSAALKIPANPDFAYPYSQSLNAPRFISFYFQKGAVTRQYWINPADTITIGWKEGSPEIISESAKSFQENNFMNLLFKEIPETNRHAIRMIPHNMPMESRDSIFKGIYARQLNFIHQRRSDFNLTDSFCEILHQFFFSGMLINQYAEQVFQYQFAVGISDYYKTEFLGYTDSFNNKMLAGTCEYKKAASIVNEVLNGDKKDFYAGTKKLFRHSAVKDFLLSDSFYKSLLANDTAVMKEYAGYMRLCNDTAYTNIVSRLYDFKNNNAVPAIKEKVVLLDNRGNQTDFNTLIDNEKGNVILVDFWASWCLPCKVQMPAIEKLKLKYRNSAVSFLHLSIDDDYRSWKNDYEAKQLSGSDISYIFRKPYNNELYRKITLVKIPRYILIDQQGRFYDLEAPLPGSKEISEEIDRLLNQLPIPNTHL